MAAVLGIATWAVLVILQRDQIRDLDRQAKSIANALTTAIEPLATTDAGEAFKARVATLSNKRGSFRLEVVAFAGQKPNNSWAGLVEESTKLNAPVGRLFEVQGVPPFYAMAIPIHNAGQHIPTRQITAFLGLVHDGAFIGQEMLTTGKRLLPIMLLLVITFGIAVYVVFYRRVSLPLQTLIDATDDVAKGDLSRAVLPEKDDEVGQLAGRFNAMMSYLRDAREKEAKATSDHLVIEERLFRTEKLATLGQMAAEIAHEVGTPLNVIGGRARSLSRRATDPTEVQKNAEIISNQVDRITKIIRQALDFSRKSRPTVGTVDVRKVLLDTLEFVDEKLKQHRIETRLTTDPDLQPIPGDPDGIQQVCLNLIMNAIQVMPSGGRLEMNLSYVVRRKEGMELSPPSPYLLLVITDTGPGVSPVDRTRIFEAFFTTKESGQGSGLGLAVSHGIVKDHDGFMEVDDAPRGGALFRVFLPVGVANENPTTPSDITLLPTT
jgi:signal transduction histidine kinase